ALGDSYAAVGRIARGAWSPGPVGCVRADDAYPAVVARALGAGTFVNASCGGAVTDDLWEAEHRAPPQLDALDAGSARVSLTTGTPGRCRWRTWRRPRSPRGSTRPRAART